MYRCLHANPQQSLLPIRSSCQVRLGTEPISVSVTFPSISLSVGNLNGRPGTGDWQRHESIHVQYVMVGVVVLDGAGVQTERKLMTSWGTRQGRTGASLPTAQRRVTLLATY